MGWRFGVTSLGPEELDAVKAFAAEHGSRSDGPIDEAWWSAAEDPRSLGPTGLGGSYASAGVLPATLSDLVDTWLFMREWQAAGRRAPERLVIVPFSLWLEDQTPEAVAELGLPDGGRLVITEPLRLLDHWPGFDDPSYEAASEQGWERLRAGDETLMAAEDDASLERLTLGLHRGLRETAKRAWKARIAWSISW